MTKLEKLLAGLCPDGVEYREIGNVCEVLTGGEAPDKSIKGKEPCGEYIYPVYSNGIGDNAIWGYSTEYRINRTAVTFSSIGTIGFPTIREPFFTPIIRLKVIYPKDDNVLNIYFLKYALEIVEFEQQKSSVPNVNASMIKKISIPVPPIEVQGEIARILDNFTELTVKLTAELTARKKQYEYYREQILSEIKNAKMCELQEIVADDCSISYGIVQTGDDVADGVPVVRPVDLVNKIVSLNGLKKVASSISDSYKRTVLKGGDLLVCVRGTTGVISIASDELRGCNVSRGIVPLTFKKTVCSDYIYYQLISNHLQEAIKAKTKGTALKQINMEDLRHISIPIPSHQEQQHIARILDRFDKLCNDISEGLPAEIEARRKQYEYYRDKLLTFTPKG